MQDAYRIMLSTPCSENLSQHQLQKPTWRDPFRGEVLPKTQQSELLGDQGMALHPADVDRPGPGPHESEDSFLTNLLCRSLLRMDTKAVAHKR